MIKHLDIYDFDETLVRAPSFTNKKAVEKRYPEHQFNHAYEFYDHSASLCEEVNHIQLIEPVYEFWKEATASPGVMTALVTHRVSHLEEEVKKVLANRGVTMDRYFFYGRTTPKFKAIEEMLADFPNIVKVRIFDDSYEQINGYLRYIDLITESGSNVEFEIWAIDKSKIFKVNSMQLGEYKRITLL